MLDKDRNSPHAMLMSRIESARSLINARVADIDRANKSIREQEIIIEQFTEALEKLEA